MGHLGSKSWSLGQIIEKNNRSFTFQNMFVKVCQYICFYSVDAKFEYRLRRIKIGQ